MTIVQVASFGRNKKGIHTFRINGDKEDIYKIIHEARKMGWKFWDVPNIIKTHRTYTVLLQIYDPKELYKSNRTPAAGTKNSREKINIENL